MYLEKLSIYKTLYELIKVSNQLVIIDQTLSFHLLIRQLGKTYNFYFKVTFLIG